MERMNRALIWLSILALVAGVAAIIFRANQVGETINLSGGPSGFTGTLPDLVAYCVQWIYYPLFLFLANGVAVSGVMIAGMTRRWGWFALTLTVTLIVFLAPNLLNYPPLAVSLSSGSPNGLGHWIAVNIFSLLYGMYLLPVAVVSLMALTSRAASQRRGAGNGSALRA